MTPQTMLTYTIISAVTVVEIGTKTAVFSNIELVVVPCLSLLTE